MQKIIVIFLMAVAGYSSYAHATPKIEHWTTSNGARVYYAAAPTLPMIDIKILFDAGGEHDGAQLGLAAMTSALLPDGTGDLSADEVAARFEGVGIRFSTHAERDSAAVSLRSLTRPDVLAIALDLANRVLRAPSFPPNALERTRAQMLAGLKAEQQSPAALADAAFMAAAYGDHPYARKPSGTEQTLTALTREDVINFHRRYYVGRNAVVAIVGAVDRAQAQALAETLLKDLPAGEPAPRVAPAGALTAEKTQRIEHPSAQTHILIGQPSINRLDPDFWPLYVGNHTLGGSGLVSRMSNEVREKRGLAYSAYSYFMPLRAGGPFEMGVQTRNDQVDEALSVMKTTLNDFIKTGPTSAELRAAKDNITGGFALRTDSNQKIVNYLGMIGYYGLPLDYLDTFIERVNAVTVTQVKAAFAKHIHPTRLVTVIVGGKNNTPVAAPVSSGGHGAGGHRGH